LPIRRPVENRVKIRPLPEIDLARIAPLSSERKLKELEIFRLGHPLLSYNPMRSTLSDILDVEAGMFELGRVPWHRVAETIARRSCSDEEEKANLQAAEGLYRFAQARRLRGRKHDFLPLPLGVGHRVVYWHSLVLIDGGLPFVPFFDPRRARGLTPEARRFVFSMMHERIRVADPDFADVRLGIFQFARVDEGPREPRFYSDEKVALFGFDELDKMVRETYDLWREVCEERDKENRRKAGGLRGGLI
jgi:hypothetical protein